MGLKASKDKKDSEFHTNWDQNFVSIGIHELQDDEFDRTHTNTTGNTSIVRDMVHRYSSLEEVNAALSKEGLKASKLLIGIDFTKSNEWTGKVSLNNRSLHAIGYTSIPYEKAISVMGKTLSPFDEDNLIPCFGFGDGPTSYAPVIEAAIDIVEKSGGQYHVLLIIVAGQVTRSSDISDKELSTQEEQTLKSIVNVRSYPLSIVVVRVGDGSWEDMKNFSDELRARECHYFKVCPICLTNAKELAFGCGHLTCRDCSELSFCPMCREPITSRQRMYI